ncbi:MAG: hypothetical protein U5L45_06865 [Saprospiraceae bacterium]|nr:hypothetical protein [Saprospiraceae bacterium]
MEQLNILEKNIAKKDFDRVSGVLVDLMNIVPKTAPKNGLSQNFILEDFEQYLTKLITHDVLSNREERFAVIDFLYKLQARREAIALMSRASNMDEIKKASKSLGRKMAVPQTEPFGVSIAKQ